MTDGSNGIRKQKEVGRKKGRNVLIKMKNI